MWIHNLDRGESEWIQRWQKKALSDLSSSFITQNHYSDLPWPIYSDSLQGVQLGNNPAHA